ncbi:DEAD/DEAH box helicase family protein [Pedobacter hartonius]|uniref:Uncharacterized protein n=1 Tax=Pedobacter hartonius TaxID=425514 RepID=A0A1H4DVU1_9SPHI|nr:DEAD/DEAH box helicase family protein [Pedobacter hartonius]SEA76861.1 hypothetical protein SAMN05443550_105127 [Pedobacter hartonius]
MYNNLFLPEGKYLGDIITKLPANKIIYKYLTGCGATHLEIFCNRWSIIVEPYIPVILGKQWKEVQTNDGLEIIRNLDVLPIYEKTKTDDIIDFLSSKRDKYKLVTTPEGMKKIIDACDELGIDVYQKFFLLVDECEKLIQDANFREGIIQVMNYFFKFKKRSFISATPLAPSDPRFAEHQFEDFIITPETMSKMPIDLYTTNNIASTLRNYLAKNKNEHYLIFINSTERIAAVITFLKIQEESQVFCSKESADILIANNIRDATEHWDKGKFKKYNFFTSRFFTAFDLKVDGKPNVLIISDVVNVAHSVLDAQTDIIQIAGRARNGINHLAHITNWDASLKSVSALEVKAYINGLKDGYYMIKQLRDQSNNNHNSGTYFVLDEALRTCSFNKFLNKTTMDICHFMIDNDIHANRIRGYYKSRNYIINSYDEAGRFLVNHIPENYNLEDKDLDRLKKGLSRTLAMEHICELFKMYADVEEQTPFTLNINFAFIDLIKTHQTKYRYFHELGIEKIRELKFNEKKIEEAYKLSKIKNSDSYYKLMFSFLAIFNEGRKLTGNQIRKYLNIYYEKHGVKLRATIKQLGEWFEISTRTTIYYKEDGTEVKGYTIGRPKNGIELRKPFRH